MASLSSRSVIYWAVAFLLATGGGVLWVQDHSITEERVEALGNEHVEETHRAIAVQYHTLREDLIEQAERLARDSTIIRGLRTAEGITQRPPELVSHLNRLDLGKHEAVEVYSPTPRLLGWSGFSMPLDAAPDHEAFLRDTQVAVAHKEGAQTALVVWAPIRVEGRALGAIRMMRLVRIDPPVQNRFIRSYRLSAQWAASLPLPVDVSWYSDPASADRADVQRSNTRTLHNLHGEAIAQVHVVQPSHAQLTRLAQQRIGDVRSALILALFVWLLGGAAYRFVQAWTRARRRQTHTLFPLMQWGAVLVGGIMILRYVALAIDMPVRWIDGMAAGSTLFDPANLASGIGGGLMRSIGDLLLTGGAAFGIAVVCFAVGLKLRPVWPNSRSWREHLRERTPGWPSLPLTAVVCTALPLIGLSGGLAVAYVVERAVVDSTLNFFARTGLLAEPLILVVFSGLMLLVVGLFLVLITLWWTTARLVLYTWPGYGISALAGVSSAAALAATALLLFFVTPSSVVAPLVAAGLLVGAGGVALAGYSWRHYGLNQLTLKHLLPAAVLLATALYAMLYVGMDVQRQSRMAEAAQSFAEGRNPRLLFALQQIVDGVSNDLNQWDQPSITADSLDAIATDALRGSLLTSLSPYESRLVLLDSSGTPQTQYATPGVQPERVRFSPEDEEIFQRMQTLYAMQGGSGPIATPLPDDLSRDHRTQGGVEYVGLQRVTGPSPLHWVMVRIESRAGLLGSGRDIPRVFLPDGSYSDLYAELALADFRKGTLQRSQGAAFEQGRLPFPVRQRLQDEPSFWERATDDSQRFLTYYRAGPAEEQVVAARLPTIMIFDHLYYLFRITVAVLGLGTVLYLIGLALRYRFGLLPAERVRFRDKVLSAFLAVGVAAAFAVGGIGVQVVKDEGDRSVEQRLNEMLTRIEESLALEARSGERIFRTVERIDMNALSVRMGTDLDVYEDGLLTETSRPRLVRDGLVAPRLPMDVYQALYLEQRRFTTAQAAIGTFEYRVGYKALTDDEGRPRVVLAVPTLAQQERLEEEQARTLAYLFGALLMLVIVVMITASLVANAIAQPIAQLREGLQAVGEGRFARMLPVQTRDEIGELVQTFNDMRAQLAEQRRQLAQQEREMAWREMARQVAHEIKNPLTPMKLSLQHLQRAFQRRRSAIADAEGEHPDEDTFAELFERITNTLIDQINTLSRIANEFSSFARLPTRVLEPLDVNEVAQEAVQLMREEASEEAITTQWHSEPLVVEADREELRRVCINLLKNALQAIPDERDPHIRVATRRKDADDGPPHGRAELTVKDNGVGIPADKRDKIFQPNFSTKTSGTGLGLAIAHKTLRELDGDITFTTTEGVGTTFRIHLPLTDEADTL